jgi:hypothetical protein
MAHHLAGGVGVQPCTREVQGLGHGQRLPHIGLGQHQDFAS